MTLEQYRRVREIFEGALDRETHEQGAWIAQQAGDDPVVQEEVVSLLNHHSRAGSFLNHPVVERVPELLAEDAVLSPGATLGSYVVIKEVGRGGMGRVYLASDTRLGRQVAIKALAPHLTRDPLQRERLRREARAAAGLTHPGICAVYALEEVDDELFIVTEFVEGTTLREEIAAGRRPSSSEILRTGREIASALADAHGRGIVHRDLKPENIMRTRDGRLKILDFGLARIDTGSAPRTFVTEPGLLIGTPAYMAPEQLNGRPVDARADVFAFGAVFYEFICGVHPFAAATPLATVARVLESEARPLAQQCPHVPMAIVDCVERCLRKSPEDRYRSAGEIAQALERAGEAAASPSPGGSAWWRIHQLVIMAIYIVTAALAWQIKEWVKTPMTESIFIGLGVGAAIGGVLRGHLIFTELINRRSLGMERRRAGGALMVVDVLMALALVADATKLTTWPLTAMLTMALGVGIVLAAVVLEPATTRAALGDI
jgi:eukaryotic-like serine/threonine-protein kinase